MTRRLIFGVVALIVILAAAGAWWIRGRMAGVEEPFATEASPEVADAAEAKLRRFREDPDTLRLSAVEVTSLLRYRQNGLESVGLSDPSVLMSGDTVRLGGRVPTDRLPAHPEIDKVRPFLPDTAAVRLSGRVVELAGGRTALEVIEVTFAEIPIPERFYGGMLARFGRSQDGSLPANVVPLVLPDGVSGARVEGGVLVLHP